MDPLSVIASVVGILAVAAKVSSALMKHAGAPKSIRDVQAEVDAMRGALGQLQAFILRKAAINRSGAALILVEQVIVTLAGCVTTFSELEVMVDSLKLDEEMGILDRIRWSTKEQTIESMISRLQNHKLSLIMMLTILQS
jgi:hypothetical protein